MRTRFLLLLALAVFLVPIAARNAAGAKLIRDTEIENTIRAFGSPLFEAAGLRSADIRIFIIADDSLNAFVAGGQNLFLHTGLLMAAKSPNQLIGVIAHETGHIAGGHLARIAGRMRGAGSTALVATILGALTAIASGSGKAGAAVALGGQGIALGSVLAFSRAQESAADQAALNLLDETGQSARGMRDFFKKLEDQELLPPRLQNPYVRTHPITRYRVEAVETHLQQSAYTNAPPKPRNVERFARLRAKLGAFLNSPSHTLEEYPTSNTSMAARYARAIAHYRNNDLDKALPLINDLIKTEPLNPFFQELKGQALLEGGRINEALAPYEKAAKLAPDSGLIRVDLARVQLAINRPELVKAALDNLLFTTRKNPELALGWQQLAIAYGRDGQIAMSNVASAEHALMRGRLKDAIYHAGRAQKKLPSGSAGWVRAEDIKQLARRRLKERKDRR